MHYDAAFSRNLGWTTEWEQAAFRLKRVAIAGMGGVGGIHLLTLARLGIGQFHIADFDRFDVVSDQCAIAPCAPIRYSRERGTRKCLWV